MKKRTIVSAAVALAALAAASRAACAAQPAEEPLSQGLREAKLDLAQASLARAPLEIPGKSDAAQSWRAFVALLSTKGLDLVDREGAPQKALWRGNTDHATLDENRPWGEIAYLLLRKEDRLRFEKLLFKADAEGRLVYVEKRSGFRFQEHAKALWPAAPDWAENGDEVSEASLQAWRRALDSWARPPRPGMAAAQEPARGRRSSAVLLRRNKL